MSGMKKVPRCVEVPAGGQHPQRCVFPAGHAGKEHAGSWVSFDDAMPHGLVTVIDRDFVMVRDRKGVKS